MTRIGAKIVLNQIQSLLVAGTASGIRDRQLLERFVAHRDDVGEAAFAALVHRHGPMVLKVCGQLLGNAHAAEDAFQATFLVLARRAGQIREPERLGPWLHGVACRVAHEARAGFDASRRQRHIAREGADVLNDEGRPDLLAARREECQALHEEVGRLPATYRAAIVLCYFEGLTHEEAANRLRWPVGTVSVRLRRARKLLEERLSRRGLAPASAAVLQIPVSGARAEAAATAVPAWLVDATTRAAGSGAVTLTSVAGPTSTAAAAFAEGVLKTMFWNRIRNFAVVLLAVGVTVTGSAVGFYQFNKAPQSKPEASKQGAVAKPEDQARPAPVQTSPAISPFSPRTQSRIKIAKEMRDTHFRSWSAGEIDLERYLLWQRRFVDLTWTEAAQAKGFDLVKFCEKELEGWQHLEKMVAGLVEKGKVGTVDVQTVEFFRLEAEEKLERAKSKVKERSATGDGKVNSGPTSR